MNVLRVEIVLPNRQRFDLTTGVELSEQPVLKDKLDVKTGGLLARVQVFPTLEGFQVERYPPDGRSIRFSPDQISFVPPESQNTWGDLFTVRRTTPVGIVFADNTELQVTRAEM